MDIRPLLQLSTVLLAVGAGAYYGWGGLTPDTVASDDGSGPDYIVEQVQLWQTDAQGNLLRRMQGTQLTHHAQPERFHLTQPNVQLYSQGALLWRLTAAQADSPNPATDLWLSGNVVAQRLQSAEPLRLETSRLHANPRGDRLDTPAAVRVISPRGTMTGVGMNVDLRAKSVELNSAVEVNYAPSY
ncbi:MAG: LPS export ABC transporter periplasmic protein LptC [Pseudomonadota bacterium]